MVEERIQVVVDDSVRELLEKAARRLGFGEFHGNMDVELGRGPTVLGVYRKDRITGDQLDRFDPAGK